MTDTDDKAAPSGPPGPSNLFTNLFKSLTGPQFQLWVQNSSILNSLIEVSNFPPRPCPDPIG